MDTIAIISKPQKPEVAEVLPSLVQWISGHGMRAAGDLETGAYLPGLPAVDRQAMATLHPKLVIVLGGDGTLLAAARAVAAADVPILSVNLGTLGFLTEVPLNRLYDALESWTRGVCPMELRTMLSIELLRDGATISRYRALNDVVVSKGTFSRLSDFRVELDGKRVATYKADGVIVSTPTGSTAYSLAAGGPVLLPDVGAFVITPVCPHTLTNRPLVVRDSSSIAILSEEVLRDNAFLTVDGQAGEELQAGDRIHCRRSEHQVRLIRLGDMSFFDVLRTKLHWGER